MKRKVTKFGNSAKVSCPKVFSDKEDPPWLFRYETPVQKAAFIAANAAFIVGAICYALSDRHIPFIPS